MKFGKRHYRPQVDQMDCGVASLAMVFGYYGSYYSLAHLRELAKTTMDGTTALGLVKVATNIISENIPHAQRYQPINAGAVSPLKKMVNKAHVHQNAP